MKKQYNKIPTTWQYSPSPDLRNKNAIQPTHCPQTTVNQFIDPVYCIPKNSMPLKDQIIYLKRELQQYKKYVKSYQSLFIKNKKLEEEMGNLLQQLEKKNNDTQVQDETNELQSLRKQNQALKIDRQNYILEYKLFYEKQIEQQIQKLNHKFQENYLQHIIRLQDKIQRVIEDQQEIKRYRNCFNQNKTQKMVLKQTYSKNQLSRSSILSVIDIEFEREKQKSFRQFKLQQQLNIGLSNNSGYYQETKRQNQIIIKKLGQIELELQNQKRINESLYQQIYKLKSILKQKQQSNKHKEQFIKTIKQQFIDIKKFIKSNRSKSQQSQETIQLTMKIKELECQKSRMHKYINQLNSKIGILQRQIKQLVSFGSNEFNQEDFDHSNRQYQSHDNNNIFGKMEQIKLLHKAFQH